MPGDGSLDMKKAICNIEFKISLSSEFYHVQNALIARLDSSCIVAIMPMKKAVQKSFSLSKSYIYIFF